ncbi:MAG: hypothetical protein LBJ59_00820 [Zoogloeaceae bacterium]|jgi:hypothetical protein|nr:hypothetical protein [Zoogloeaceae bacterium]
MANENGSGWSGNVKFVFPLDGGSKNKPYVEVSLGHDSSSGKVSGNARFDSNGNIINGSVGVTGRSSDGSTTGSITGNFDSNGWTSGSVGVTGRSSDGSTTGSITGNFGNSGLNGGSLNISGKNDDGSSLNAGWGSKTGFGLGAGYQDGTGTTTELTGNGDGLGLKISNKDGSLGLNIPLNGGLPTFDFKGKGAQDTVKPTRPGITDWGKTGDTDENQSNDPEIPAVPKNDPSKGGCSDEGGCPEDGCAEEDCSCTQHPPVLPDGTIDLPSCIRDPFRQAEKLSSPLVLDLDGDGVETLGLAAGAHFDHDGNGFAELTGWAGADDGLLVLDRNGNGVIDDGGRTLRRQRVPCGRKKRGQRFSGSG